MTSVTKVLHMIDTGGPGGAETMFVQLVSRWPRNDDNVVAVVSREGWLASELRRLGHEPFIFDPKGSFNFGYLWALCKLIRREDIDIVVGHLFGSCVYASLAGSLTNTPVVGVLHGQSDVSPGSFLAGFKAVLLRHRMKRLVCVSDELRDVLLSQLRFPASRSVVIHNGISTGQFEPSKRTARQNIMIGAVGNIRKPKGYDTLIRAAAIVVAQIPTARFKIVGQGEGKLMDELLALRDSLGLTEVVEFTGFLPSGTNLYTDFDIYVSSSITEGFSLTCVEAMACGLPVIATRSGGPEEIIDDGETGLLVDRGSPEKLAEAILRVAQDSDLGNALASHARRSVLARFDIEQTVRAYVNLCNEVVISSSE